MSSLACSEEHSAEEKEHGQRMVQRVQLHMHEGTLGRYRKGGRGSSQEPENVPRSRTGQLVELSTVRTPNLANEDGLSVRTYTENFFLHT